MLEPILTDARRRADEVAGCAPRFRGACAGLAPARPFRSALAGPGLSIVSEVKRRSPSRGVLADGLDAVAQATIYEDAGAAAISVLTEPDHFDGSLEDLRAVHDAVMLPVLRKDFLVDPAQVWEARAFGADAVLLIVAVIGSEALGLMLETAGDAGIDALVEVHNEEEAAIAVASGADLIGVNNRNLSTFVTDLSVAERLAPMAQSGGAIIIAESGIHTRDDAERMVVAGYDAILVGEALVTAADPAATLSELRGDR